MPPGAEITGRGSNYRTEGIGGATTFLTLVYIVFVNPAILSGTVDLSATIIVTPVTYSIANGVGVGIILHTASELLAGRRVNLLLLVFSGFLVWYFIHGTV